MSGHLFRALLDELDDQALDELAALLAPRLAQRPAPPPEPDDGLLSPSDAAGRVKLSRKTIYRAVTSGDLPARKVVGQWRISRDDLEEWSQRTREERRRRARGTTVRATEATNQAVAAITGGQR